jgi:hypothetical protein
MRRPWPTGGCRAKLKKRRKKEDIRYNSWQLMTIMTPLVRKIINNGPVVGRSKIALFLSIGQKLVFLYKALFTK